MFLLFLCLGTILAPSCLASCQQSSSLPPSSGSVVAASLNPFSRSTTSLRRSAPWIPLLHHPSRVLRRGHRRQQPQGLHSWRRRAWQPVSLQQTAGFAPRQGSCHSQVGLIFRPSGFFTFPSGHKTVPELFSYLARMFLHDWDWRSHHRLHRHGTRPVNGHRHRGWTSDLFSFQPRPELGGSPVEACLQPWWTVTPAGCTPVTLYCSCV
jgi:hypothetical protein